MGNEEMTLRDLVPGIEPGYKELRVPDFDHSVTPAPAILSREMR